AGAVAPPPGAVPCLRGSRAAARLVYRSGDIAVFGAGALRQHPRTLRQSVRRGRSHGARPEAGGELDRPPGPSPGAISPQSDRQGLRGVREPGAPGWSGAPELRASRPPAAPRHTGRTSPGRVVAAPVPMVLRVVRQNLGSTLRVHGTLAGGLAAERARDVRGHASPLG